jgi:hypothetical protein
MFEIAFLEEGKHLGKDHMSRNIGLQKWQTKKTIFSLPKRPKFDSIDAKTASSMSGDFVSIPSEIQRII